MCSNAVAASANIDAQRSSGHLAFRALRGASGSATPSCAFSKARFMAPTSSSAPTWAPAWSICSVRAAKPSCMQSQSGSSRPCAAACSSLGANTLAIGSARVGERSSKARVKLEPKAPSSPSKANSSAPALSKNSTASGSWRSSASPSRRLSSSSSSSSLRVPNEAPESTAERSASTSTRRCGQPLSRVVHNMRAAAFRLPAVHSSAP
mmetsp:Transcript_8539/g.20077  ORF Transcript_8539/g.20077 Transcript_8539/m.20077 type:complete len:208 (+) Transcript_8539:1053-1676(+)